MRILIVEEALRAGNGHWPRYIADLAGGFRSGGDWVEVLGHQEANEKVKAVVEGVVPWLSRDCRVDRRSQGLIGGIRHNLTLKKELEAWLKVHEPYDWVLSLSSRAKHLLAFAQLAHAKRYSSSRFLLLFVLGPGQRDDAGNFRMSASNLFAKFCFALLRPAVQRGQVVIAAETKGMQAEIEKFTGLPVVLFPHPVVMPEAADGANHEIHEPHEKEEYDLTTIEHRGRCEMEQPEVGPKGEGVGTNESNYTDGHGWGEAGLRLEKPSGAAFSNPSTSELARDSENTSLYRSASIPAPALRADEDRRSEDGPMEYSEHSTGERGLKTDLEDLNTDSLDNPPSAIRYQTSGSAKPILVVAPGLARYEKGSDILQKAVKLVLKDEPNDAPIRFVLQWSENFVLPNGSRCWLDAELINDGRVEFSKDLLIGDEYLDFLRRADLIVLPYRSESYRARVSRVAIEAAMMGKPMVYSKGIWIKEVVDLAGGGVEVREETAEALEEAIEMAIADFEKLRSLAESGAERVRDFYNVASFRKLLCSVGEKNN